MSLEMAPPMQFIPLRVFAKESGLIVGLSRSPDEIGRYTMSSLRTVCNNAVYLRMDLSRPDVLIINDEFGDTFTSTRGGEEEDMFVWENGLLLVVCRLS